LLRRLVVCLHATVSERYAASVSEDVGKMFFRKPVMKAEDCMANNPEDHNLILLRPESLEPYTNETFRRIKLSA
jgi:hypothetical protein